MENKTDPGKGSQLEDRPAFNEAHIQWRSEGRQIRITTGDDPEPDDLDVHPEAEGEVDPDGRAPVTPQGEDQHIHGFSEDSRRRLREKAHSMRRDAPGLFVTLTYHETCPSTEKIKEDFDTFWKWIEREYGGDYVRSPSCIWKMEPQDRGVPHIHLVVYGVPFVPAQKISKRWHEITAETSEKHRKSGVDIETAVNRDGKLLSYLAEYFAESYQAWPGNEDGGWWAETGRWWGTRGQDSLPEAEWSSRAIPLSRANAQRLIRELLDEWGADLPDEVVPPVLTINTRGDPTDRVRSLLDRL